MNTLYIALRNVVALRRRLVGQLVLLAIAVGLCLTAFGVSDRTAAASDTGILQSVANRSIAVDAPSGRPNAPLLTGQLVAQLRKMPGVQSVEPRAQASFGYKGGDVPGALLYATVARSSLLPPIVKSQRPSLFPLRAGEAVLPVRADGNTLGSLFGKTIDVQTVTKTGTSSGTGSHGRLRVVGLYDPKWQIDGPAAAYVGTPTVIDWAALAAGVPPAQYTELVGYDSMTVVALKSDQVSGLLSRIQAKGLSASSLQQQLSALPSLLGLVRAASKGLLAVLAVVALLATFSLTGSLVRQRTREIGVLKATGFRDRAVFGIFLTESVITAVAAVVAGLALGAVGAAALRSVLRRSEDLAQYLPSSLPLPSLLTTLLIAAVTIVVVAIGACTPAARAARMDPVDAVRDW